MASARTTATTRRTSRPAEDQADVSGARWAGVALVIASLLGAVALAVVSPGDDEASAGVAAVGAGEAEVTALPSTTPFPSGALAPSARPAIITPRQDDVVAEYDVSMTVQVPRDPLPRRQLTLVIFRGDEIVQTFKRPRPEEVTVDGVRLEDGINELSAALQGPEGVIGPRSDPVTVLVDRTPPDLILSAPEAKTQTTQTTILVAGHSEPGATVVVRNRTAGWKDPAVVGPGGDFEASVPLEDGVNRIVVVSTDPAGAEERATVRVTKLDGKPAAKLRRIKDVRRAALPTQVRIRVAVTDAQGKPVRGAEVAFTLSVPGQETDGHTTETANDGRAVWPVRIPGEGTEVGTGTITVDVSAPNGESVKDAIEFEVS